MGRTRTVNGIEYPVSDSHPAAEVLPWMSDAELEELAKDIAEKGQAVPIMRTMGEEIIDGRNRELACRMRGIEPLYKTVSMSWEEIVGIVVSLNMPRRHLNTSQRSMVAAEFATMLSGHRTDLEPPATLPEVPANAGKSSVSQGKAAEMMNVSERSVRSANAVKRDAPELVEAVKEGKIDVATAAKVARLPKEERKKVAKAADPKKKAREVLAKEAVAQAHEEATGESALVPPTQTDEWGIPVQAHATEAFAATEKFKELANAIRTAQRLFNEVANLPGGVFLTLPEVSSYRRGKKLDDGTNADLFVHEGLEQALHHVKNAIPKHTVCPYQYADAPHPEKCRCCLGLNWTPAISTNVPPVCIERAKKAHGVTEGE